jgi:hypothetical protein
MHRIVDRLAGERHPQFRRNAPEQMKNQSTVSTSISRVASSVTLASSIRPPNSSISGISSPRT